MWGKLLRHDPHGSILLRMSFMKVNCSSCHSVGFRLRILFIILSSTPLSVRFDFPLVVLWISLRAYLVWPRSYSHGKCVLVTISHSGIAAHVLPRLQFGIKMFPNWSPMCFSLPCSILISYWSSSVTTAKIGNPCLLITVPRVPNGQTVAITYGLMGLLLLFPNRNSPIWKPSE